MSNTLAHKDFMQLNLIIMLNSFIPLIVRVISIPSVEIVFLRSMAACLMLGIFVYIQKLNYSVGAKEIGHMLLSGLLTSTYSILLMLSAKISTAAVCLVGMATNSVWISFLQPLLFGTKNKPFQELLGINAVMGVYIIFNSGFDYGWGLTVGIAASFFGGLLTIITSKLARKHDAFVITFYQMVGAWMGTLVFLPLYSEYLTKGAGLNFDVNLVDVILILGLAFVFYIYGYWVLIRCMKTIPPFMVALVANLSPIYGILTEMLLYGKDEMLNPGFYLGTLLLLASVFAYPILNHYLSKYTAENAEVAENNKKAGTETL